MRIIIIFIILLICVILSSIIYYNYSVKTTQIELKKERKVKVDPCFLYENIDRSQLIYLKLRDVLHKISVKNEITLGDNCKQKIYIQGTYDNRLNTEINEINDIILKKIRILTGFFFKKIKNGTITIFQDEWCNKNFIYDSFFYEYNEQLQIRLYINVIKIPRKDPENKILKTCTEITNPKMKFEAGIPQPEQLIELPTQTINTGPGELLSNKGINIKKIDPIKYLWINKVMIFNTDSVINVKDGSCITPEVCGDLKGSTTLESSEFNGPTTPWFEPSCIYNKWPLLKDNPNNNDCGKKFREWPAGEMDYFHWNDQGIYLPKTCNSHILGLRSSTTEEPLVANYYPTLATIPRATGPYFWLFEPTRTILPTERATFTVTS